MFDFHEKRKIRGILYSKWVVSFIFILAVLLLYSAYNRYTVARDMKTRLEAKKTELEELEQRASALQTEVEYLSGERGIEEELRNRFDVVKEGEQVIILLDEKPKEKTDSTTTRISNEKISENEARFLDFLPF
jgi:cell division protein FtsB